MEIQTAKTERHFVDAWAMDSDVAPLQMLQELSWSDGSLARPVLVDTFERAVPKVHSVALEVS